MISIVIEESRKLGGKYSMFVSFPYNEEIITVIRNLPQRIWLADTKQWEVPVNKLEKLLKAFPQEEFDITGTYIDLTPKAEIPDGFEFKTKPFQHQIEGFNYGLANDKWFLGDEQGLGKTKQVIDIAIAKKLQHGYKHCLIICGVNGLKYNWQNEIKIHSNEAGWILGNRYNTRSKKWRIGSSQDKLNDLINIDNIKEYFIITNVETLRYKEDTGEKNKRGKKIYDYPITNKLIELCNNHEIDMIAFDEFHKVKDPESDQGAQILRLKAETQIAMTGTPLMNSPLDLFIILKWLGYESHSYYAFSHHYCEYGGYGNYQVTGYKNLAELSEQLDDIMLRRLKKEVLDLPEKTYINEYVEMSAKQEKIYNEVTSEIKENIDMIAKAPNPLAELIRMRQATGYTGILSSTVKESAKLDRMEELVEEAVSNNQKVIIYSNWTQITDVARERLQKLYSGVVITGQTSAEDRQAAVDRFQNDPKCMYCVGSIGALGVGLTLTAATVEIFLDEPWTRAAKEQAEDRAHRVGTTQNITIYTLMCKGTIDEKIHEIVIEKGELSDALVDGKSNSIRTEMLDYLLNC